MRADDLIGIGEVARRTGLSVPTIRFYEQRGLIAPDRNAGNQRRYRRADIRRVSFVLIAQKMGLTLGEIAEKLARLPGGRTPTAQDWATISAEVKNRLVNEIARLEAIRADLDGCIGCGCLSLKNCALYNAGDRWGQGKAGPRVLR
ncbi:redox-sensitive transcriptional activator SoxR [Qipengyuania sediminis]|uniref:redox-sensitive transcriptional activator SoxR n=1 Tax=Qipengyuania sediminis TaxID=1532023 RepID=UPI001059CD28|nr:redox-sensitive transcriptional activator SoxR [Qipengyuania sediminis]